MVGCAIQKGDGLVKQCLYKATGKAQTTKQELEEVILDTEIN